MTPMRACAQRKTQMDEFTRIRTFIKVVEAGGFSAAARDVSAISTVARQVKSLEDDLGVRLLNRSTRSISLTDSGRRFYECALVIAHDLDNTLSQVRSLQVEVKGLLRVSLSVAAGTTVVVPALSRLLARYPDLSIDIALSGERADLIADNIDVGMWLGAVHGTSVVAHRLSECRRIVCASPAYLERHGTPQSAQDLRNHNCLLLGGQSCRNRLEFVRGEMHEDVDVDGSLQSDNPIALLTSGMADLGVIIVHGWMLRPLLAEGRMVQVLNDFTVDPRHDDAGLYAVYASGRGLSRKTKVFIDFLKEVFEAGQF
jgi:DNA-binding transcriptional LysR family regulator